MDRKSTNSDKPETPTWLPPGQASTAKFPLVGEAEPAPGLDEAGWRLQVGGLVSRPLELDLTQLLALPQQERSIDIHCVTGWSRRDVTMRGVPLATLLEGAGVSPQACFVRFVAHSLRGHDTSLPLPLALADTWLVHWMDGAPLPREHGGPVRTVTPGRYFYKSLKWLARIELLAADAPGYWERESAYHNEADPWREQRFDQARVATAGETRRLREAEDFAPFRGRVLLKARLGGWRPRSLDLKGLQLKYCSFRGAVLAGADLRGANLSLGNFEGADLRGCDFGGADLEGASFAGADLRGASLVDTALSATRFFRDFGGGQRLAAKVEGLRLERARGLLEDQAEFLRNAGVLDHRYF
ncbi:MAG: molybdopterin-dependent oxidoreductase [Nevskia sp.]|nr:molybdopterin-dependent oxidoreductase [Nevskia sp.]